MLTLTWLVRKLWTALAPPRRGDEPIITGEKTMKAAVLAGALLFSVAATAADDDADCQTEIINVAERTAIKARAARLIGRGEKSAAAKAFTVDAPKRWTCSLDGKAHCCNKIPVDVWVDASACFVTLPYGQLDISTTSGTKTPRVAWELRVERSADQLFKYKFAFDKMAGIKLLKVAGVPLPAKNGDLDGNDKRFKLDSTGVVNDEAGHVPRVYPKTSGGGLDSANECTPWDPTITNTN